jgi:hypothetical protein
MSKLEIVEYHDEELDKTVRLEIAHANGYVSARRSLLQGTAITANKTSTEEEAVKFARLVMYPDLVAPVVKQEGFDNWPPTLDQFLSLDELLLMQWTLAVYQANPHWQIAMPEEAEKEKNAIARS